jgi:hypothetical protein
MSVIGNIGEVSVIRNTGSPVTDTLSVIGNGFLKRTCSPMLVRYRKPFPITDRYTISYRLSVKGNVAGFV